MKDAACMHTKKHRREGLNSDVDYFLDASKAEGISRSRSVRLSFRSSIRSSLCSSVRLVYSNKGSMVFLGTIEGSFQLLWVP